MSLKEYKNTRQDRSGLVKRWFSDVSMDVFVWSNDEDISRIEVIFEEQGSKQLWSWNVGEEGQFFEVDEGDDDPRKNMSQLAHDNYDGNYQKLLLMIEQHSGDLPQSIMSVFRMLA